MIKGKEIVYVDVEKLLIGFRVMLSMFCVLCFCEDGCRSGINVRLFKVPPPP